MAHTQFANASFEAFKAEVLRIAGGKEACERQYNRAASATTANELLAVIVDNICWCAANDVATPDMLDFFGQDMCWQHGIWYRGETSVENPEKPIYLLGSSSATVKTRDSSSATVETLGSSSATVKTCGSSSATVKTCGSSSATVKTWGRSICRDLTQMKIYVCKSAYQIEIIEHD